MNSLDQAPFDVHYIPTLFYLAELVLYTIRSETSHKPLLTVFHTQLMTVGRLAFERIYFHHITGELVTFGDLKNHLCDYLDGLWSLCLLS